MMGIEWFRKQEAENILIFIISKNFKLIPILIRKADESEELLMIKKYL
jgi:hypothetical protein